VASAITQSLSSRPVHIALSVYNPLCFVLTFSLVGYLMTSLRKPLQDSGSYMHHMSEQEILHILHSQCMCCMRLLEQIAVT
jgi:hypothetical protein